MWFEHPKYKVAYRELISQLKRDSSSTSLSAKRSYLFGREPLPKIIFICGGDPEFCSNREVMEVYLKRHASNILTFRAEYAWDTIVKSRKNNINALALEEWLADFSDVVIILVESFGTVAELGAFSMATDLRRKLLPILDKQFEHVPSFINTGPVKWVNQESKYGPCIYSEFESILTCMPELISRVDLRRSRNYTTRDEEHTYGNMKFNRKELLFIVILIIISIGPVTEDIILDACKDSFNIHTKTEVSDLKFIVSLSVALGVIGCIEINEVVYYYCNSFEELKSNKSMQALMKVSQDIRAKCASSLVYIDSYNKTLNKVLNF
ncbi:retron St85 family effector protein [Shewanella spartinae]|uniref:retron St85 family effector protein n=1 Tax=Shewanella spartinae TaxID=2864205 RepID=UPI001C65E57A|nr:retron St85 family effector protein [Shewanella spartinae]QYJ92253.1 retron St85 family effector protein [Shewanella spartinae]